MESTWEPSLNGLLYDPLIFCITNLPIEVRLWWFGTDLVKLEYLNKGCKRAIYQMKGNFFSISCSTNIDAIRCIFLNI